MLKPLPLSFQDWSKSLSKNWFFSILFFLSLLTQSAYAQPVRVEGSWQSSDGSWNANIGTLTNRGLMRFFRAQTAYGGAATTRQLLFNNGSFTYNPKWTATSTANKNLNAALTADGAGATQRAIRNGADDIRFQVQGNRYYTFNIGNNGGGNNDFAILETTYNPVEINSVSTVAGTTYLGQPVTITVTTSANPATGEHVYVRYSNNNFATSALAIVSMTGSTGTATIPGQTSAVTVQYYAFTSNINPISNPAQSDFFTLNLRNSIGQNVVGSNFSYSVTGSYITAQDGPWSTAATWLGAAVPPAGANVIIDHAVTVTANPSNVGNITINNGKSLTPNANITITQNGGSTFTNNGTFNATSNTPNTIAAAGNLTVAGSSTTTFNNLTVSSGGLTFTTVPIINGTLTINLGGFLNQAPNYASGSTLNYNTGGSYNTSNEWTATTDGVAGVGRPHNVLISTTNTNVTTAGNRAIAGGITINANTTLTLGNRVLSLRENFTRNGTFSQSGSTVIIRGDGAINGANNTAFGNLTFDPAASGGSTITITTTGNTIANTFTYISGSVTNPANITTNSGAAYVFANSAGGSFQRIGINAATSLTISVNTASNISIDNFPLTQSFTTFTATNANGTPGEISLTASANTNLTFTGTPSISVTGSTKVKLSGTDLSNRFTLIANNAGVMLSLNTGSVTTIDAFGVIQTNNTGTANATASTLVFNDNSEFIVNSPTNATGTRATIPTATWNTGSTVLLRGGSGSTTFANNADAYIGLRQTFYNMTFNLTGTSFGAFGNLVTGPGFNCLGTFRVTSVNSTTTGFGLFGYNAANIPASDVTINIGNFILGDNLGTQTLSAFTLVRMVGGENYDTKRRTTINISGSFRVGNPVNNRSVNLVGLGASGASGHLGQPQEAYINVTGQTFIYGNATFSILGGHDGMTIHQTALMRARGGVELIGNTVVTATLQLNTTGTTSTGPCTGILVVGDSTAPADFNMNQAVAGRSVLEFVSNGANTGVSNQTGILKIFGNFNGNSSWGSNTNSVVAHRNITGAAGTNNTAILFVRKAANGTGGNINLTGTNQVLNLNTARTDADNGCTSYVILDGQVTASSTSQWNTSANNANNRAMIIFTGNDANQFAFGSTMAYNGTGNQNNIDFQFGLTGFNPSFWASYNATPANNYFVDGVVNGVSTGVGMLFPTSGKNLTFNGKLFDGPTFGLGGNGMFVVSRGTLNLGATPMTISVPNNVYQTANGTIDGAGAAHTFSVFGVTVNPFFFESNTPTGIANAVNTLDGTLSNYGNVTMRFSATSDGQRVPANNNYGHIDLSASNNSKIFVGNIGLTGNLTTNTSNAHTLTGTTINFKGTTQNFAHLTSGNTWNNITISNGSTTTLTNSGLTIGGTFEVENGGAFTFGNTSSRTVTMAVGSTPTINGTLNMNDAAHQFIVTTANATTLNQLTTNGGGSRITYNSAGAYTVPASANYENVTVINGTKTLAGTSSISGQLNVGNGNPTSSTFSLGNMATASPNLTVGAINLQGGNSGDNATFDFGTVRHEVDLLGGITRTGGAGSDIPVIRMQNANYHRFNIAGNVDANITYSADLATYPIVRYYGGANQNIAAWAYSNLIFEGVGTKTLNNSASVNYSFTATGGGTIATPNTITMNNNSNMFIGDFGIGCAVALANNANVGLRYSTTRTTTNEANPSFGTNAYFDSLSVEANQTVTLGNNFLLGNASDATLELKADAMISLGSFNLTVAKTGNNWFNIASPSATNKILTNSSGSLIKRAGSVDNSGLVGTYPVGPIGFYNPVVISSITGTPTNGSLSINVTGVKHPLTSSNSLAAFWNITATNLGSPVTDINFNYNTANSPTGQVNGTQANYLGRYLPTGGSWGNGGASATSSNGANPFSFTGVTSLTGAWTIGEATAFPNQFYFSRNSGFTNVNTNWSLTDHTTNNPPVAAPGAGDFVVIGNSHVMEIPTGQSLTVLGTAINANSVLEIGATTGNDLGEVSGTGTLRFTVDAGAPTLPAGNYSIFTNTGGGTVAYIGSGSYVLPNGLGTYNNLTINGGGVKTLNGTDIVVNNILSVGNGTTTTFTVQNNVTFNTGGITFLNTHSNGTYNQIAGTLTLAGSGNYTVGGNNLTFHNITIQDPAYLTINPTTQSFNLSGNLTINSNYPLAFNYANGVSRVTAATAASFIGTTTIGGSGSGLIDLGNIIVAATANVTANRDITCHGTTITCNGTFNQTTGTFTIGGFVSAPNPTTITSTGGTPSLTFNNFTHAGGNAVLNIGMSFSVRETSTDFSQNGFVFLADGGNYTFSTKNFAQGSATISCATPSAANTTHTLEILGNWSHNQTSNSNVLRATGSGFLNTANIRFAGTTGTMTVSGTAGRVIANSIEHAQFGPDGVTPTSPVVWSMPNSGFPWATNQFYGNFTHNSASDFTVTGANTFAFISGGAQTIGGTGAGNLTLNCLAVDGASTSLSATKDIRLNGNMTTTNQVQMTTLYIGDQVPNPSFNLNNHTLSILTGGMIWNRPATPASFNTGTGHVLITPAVNTNMSFNGGITFNNLTFVPNGGTLSTSSASGTFTLNGLIELNNASWVNSGTHTYAINGTFRTSNNNGLFGAANSAITSGGTPTINIGASSTIEYYSSANQAVTPSTSYNNVKLLGAGTKTLGAGNISLSGNLEIANGLTFNMGGTARVLTLSGNLIASGATIDIVGAAHTLNLAGASNELGTLNTSTGNTPLVNYTSSGAQTIFGSPNYRSLTFSGGGTKTMLGNITASGTLTMTSGNVELGDFNFTLGTSPSNTGVLSYSSGRFLATGTGSLVRWYGTTLLPTSPLFAGYFPVGTSVSNREAYVIFSSATALSTGGTISLQHTNVIGDQSVNFLDGAEQIDRRSQSSWTVSTSGMVLGTGTIRLNLQGSGAVIVNAGQVANVRMVRSGDAVGSHNAGTGTEANPVCSRTFNSLSDLNSTFYIGGSNTTILNAFINSITSGAWSNPSTWDCACTPTAVNFVTIGSTHEVNLTANGVANSLTVGPTATIDLSTYKLTLSSGGSATIQGTAKTANSTGLTGAANAAFDNTNSPTVTLATGSTVDYNGDEGTAQNITALNYSNLTISGNRSNNIVLPNGTIGIGEAFSPTATFSSGAYVNTGNTINFSASTAQTIPAFAYNNLSNSGNGARTLQGSGTISIAGAYTPTTGALTVAGSTVDFVGNAQTLPYSTYHNLTVSGTSSTFPGTTGTYLILGSFSPNATTYPNVANTTFNYGSTSAQTIAAFNYHNLTSSSTGDRTLANAGTIGIGGVFNQGSNVYTVSGSTVNYNGTVGQTVRQMTYNNLTLSGAKSGNIVFESGTITVTGVFTSSATTTGYTIASNNFIFSNNGNQNIDLTGATSPIRFNNVTFNNPGANLSLVGGDIEVTNQAFFTAGNLLLGNQNFTMGNSGSNVGQLWRNNGANIITNGTGYLWRWFGSASPVCDGQQLFSSPTNHCGSNGANERATVFNLGTTNGGNRWANVYPYNNPSNITTSGRIGMRYVDGTGLSTVADFTDGPSNNITINRRSNGYWEVTTAGGLAATHGFAMSLYNSNQGFGTAANCMLIDDSGAPITGSTAVNGTAFQTGLYVTRVNLSVAQLTGDKKYYQGGNAADLINVIIANGATSDWGLTTTWQDGVLPTSGDDALIPTGRNITLTTGTSFNCRRVTVQAGATLDLLDKQLTTHGTSNQVTVTGTLRTARAQGLFSGANGAVTGSGTSVFTFNSSSTLEYYSNSAQVITALSGTGSHQNIVSSGTGSRSFGAGTISILGNFTVDNANTFTAPSASSTVSFPSGNQPVPGAWYHNLSMGAGIKTFQTNLPITVSGALTSSGTVVATGTTVIYNGTGAQTIAALTYNNLTVTGTRTANTNITLDNSAVIGIGGVFNFEAVLQGTGTFINTGSTVDYMSASAQTIAPINYFNLTNSGNGNRTLSPTGVIGIYNNFSLGSGSYTITNSTVDFNGAVGQEIPAGNYFNLSVSPNSTRVLANSGVINVAGTFSPGTSTYTIAGSTINYNGANGQTIAGFRYNNLTSTNNSRVIAPSTTVEIEGTFTTGSGAYTTTGSTVTFRGGNQSIPNVSGGYNNLTFTGTGTKTVAEAIQVNTAGNLNLVASNVDNSSFNISVAAGATINRSGGTISNAPVFGAGVNVNYTQALTTGPELPTAADRLANLTINPGASNTVTMGGNTTVNNTLALTSGRLAIASNTLSIAGTVSGSGEFTGSSSSNLTIAGTSGGNVGTLTFGPNAGDRVLNNLNINRNGGACEALLGTNLAIAGNLTFGGSATCRLLTNGNVLDLGTTGALVGEAAGRYVVGQVTAQRTLNDGSETFGNIGATITGCTNCDMGVTNITRFSGAGASRTGINSTQSINRYFDISPTDQPSSPVTLTMSWNSDDNFYPTPAALSRAWRSTNNGTTWLPVGAPATFEDYSITVPASQFSLWTISDDNNILPVELASFKGARKDRNVQLSWTTLSEKNNKGFYVERSLDGTDFQNIGFIKGNGNSLTRNNYAYTDYGQVKDAYYRLRQQDFDGTEELSDVIRVNALDANQEMVVIYNPTTKSISVAHATEKMFIQVVDAAGRKVLESELQPNQTITIPTRIAAGIYNVWVANSQTQINQRIVME